MGRFLFEGRPVSHELVDDWIRGSQRTQAEAGHGLYLLERREAGEEVGFAGLVYFDTADELELVVGLWPRAWGRGLAVEAGLACLRLGFDGLGCEVLVAGADVPNRASLRMLDRLGFRPWRETQLDNKPVLIRAMTAGQWQADRAARGLAWLDDG